MLRIFSLWVVLVLIALLLTVATAADRTKMAGLEARVVELESVEPPTSLEAWDRLARDVGTDNANHILRLEQNVEELEEWAPRMASAVVWLLKQHQEE